MQIQTIESDLNDTMWIKKNEVILIHYSFTPSDMNLQTILMPNHAKKAGLLEPFLHFKSIL